MDSKRHYEKLEPMVNEGIKNGNYIETADTTLHYLKFCQDFYTVTLMMKKINKK